LEEIEELEAFGIPEGFAEVEPGRAALGSTEGSISVRFVLFSVLIVELALLRIVERVVGDLDSLKLLLGLRVIGVQIRMVLARKTSVGFSDFIGAGRAA
jgi:hypothetical protein